MLLDSILEYFLYSLKIDVVSYFFVKSSNVLLSFNKIPNYSKQWKEFVSPISNSVNLQHATDIGGSASSSF